ncbi:adenylate/guanylate cyclase domain-containing protein [Bacillus sp. Marseille-P3661]|uniref:adenylate/guanylate cyclase domain-containing protein n=1 Tax=Bacillus sp. Marseille-P3661 TaxID=1936234 RepID=UPI000C86535B|nr:adenylate/guanylate cyclase domain-containing protein [Bacillus sp. Marseille-P3661]
MLRKIITIAIISIVVCFFYAQNTFFIVDEFVSDRLTRGEKEVSSNIVILAIDDESLAEVGKWPWPRNVMADTAEKLAEAGAKAVFVDVLYTEESQNQAQDLEFQRVVNEHNNIYLAANFVFESKQESVGELAFESINRPIFNIDQSQVGHINVKEDRDSVVRQIMLGIPDENNEILPAISVKLANLLLADEGREISWNDNHEFFLDGKKINTSLYNEIYFSYATEPHEDSQEVISNKFDTIPIYQVINGEFPPEYFENTIVLIGPYTAGLQDQYTTPMSQVTKMNGVEIHANIIQSFLDGSIYSKASTSLVILIITVMTALSYFIIDRLKVKWGFLALVGFIGLYLVATITIYSELHILLPFFYVLLALVTVYVTSVVSQYIIEQKEKARVTGLFGRYVSKGVVDEILSSKEEVKLGGIRKDVTLVFVDIRGFTPLSEKMEPEEVILILNEYLDLCTRAVFKFEGTLDKFIGDGVMAIFGAPIEQPDHAERAVRAALEMKRHSSEMAKRLEEQYGRAVHFGVGINSGPAVIGNIGSQDRLDYTAIGDTVNLAARLESNAKPGQILISENVFERVKDLFVITPLEAIKVKGKEKPVQIYSVEDEK